jgi:prephenate dehydratase
VPPAALPEPISTPASPTAKAPRIGFLGPYGTFTEAALRGQADLGVGELVPLRSMPDVLTAVESGEVDLGFIAIENSIEGTVNVAQDELVFNHSLMIQREVVLDIEHCLSALPGTKLSDVTEVLSILVATAQCHEWLKTNLPNAERRAADSTAGAARTIAEQKLAGVAAVAPRVAADLYGLEVIAANIGDHAGNQTRFVVVAREGIPAATGHDKTSIVVYQRANEPGSLMSILAEFASRRINLTKLESRPTKAGGLGDYCFVLDAEGHIEDEVLADALRDLHAKQGGVKFLGSYPAAGTDAHDIRAHADATWQRADDWLNALRSTITQ